MLRVGGQLLVVAEDDRGEAEQPEGGEDLVEGLPVAPEAHGVRGDGDGREVRVCAVQQLHDLRRM